MKAPEDFAKLLESLLSVVDAAVRQVARRMRLSPEDAEDLTGKVLVDLCDNDYALLRAFRGESSWGTYIAMLVSSRACDQSRKVHGKFRPSRKAERMGAGASMYEILRRRDGLSCAEATRKLAEKGFAISAHEVEELEKKIGARGPRKFERLEALELLPAGGGSPEEIAREHESAAKARKIRTILRATLSELSDDERLALRWRTAGPTKTPVWKISELLGWGTEKEAFRRLERVYAALKKRFSALGVTAEEVLAILADGWPDEEPDEMRDDEDES